MRALLLAGIIFVSGSLAWADGGRVIAQVDDGGAKVVVFASPYPLQVGPADIGVLVQDQKTGKMIADAVVRVALVLREGEGGGQDWAAVCNSLNGLGTEAVAGREHSTNKLLQSAWLGVPAPGVWDLRVDVRVGGRTIVVDGTLDVPAAPAPLVAWWPFIALVPAGIGLYALRNCLIRQRQGGVVGG